MGDASIASLPQNCVFHFDRREESLIEIPQLRFAAFGMENEPVILNVAKQSEVSS